MTRTSTAVSSLMAVFSLVWATAAHATTYHVTTTADPDMTACATPASGCSLREALIAIKNTPSPPDEIDLSPGVYVNTQGVAFPIAAPLAIVGQGSSGTTIDGSAGSGVLAATSAIAGTVTISGVSIAHARGGPGIYVPNLQRLVLDRVAVVDNRPQGGAEVINGAAQITNSLFANNQSTGSGPEGAGLYVVGSSPLTISNSTITGNSATGTVGALGGGLAVVSAPTQITSSTIDGNSVSGPNAAGGDLSLSNVTGSIANSIVAGGVATDSNHSDCDLKSSTFTSDGYNLEDDTQCGFTATGDQQTVNPMLGALPAGPDATSALALLPGSPAINAGDPHGCVGTTGILSTDQRGLPRPAGARCDIGAFEFQLPAISGQPTTTGSGVVGQALTCTPAAATSQDGGTTQTALAWRRDGTAIPGANGATYPLTVADAGHAITCVQTSTNDAGPSSATSAAVDVAGAPTFAGIATLSATPVVGVPVTCRVPQVSAPGDPATVAITWLLAGSAVPGAAAYTPTAADAGRALACQVTATNHAGAVSTTSSSAAVALPSNAFTVVKTAARRRGSVSVTVALPGPGDISIAVGRTRKQSSSRNPVARTGQTAATAGNRALSISLSRTARRRLALPHATRLFVSITFTPTGGRPATKTIRLLVRR